MSDVQAELDHHMSHVEPWRWDLGVLYASEGGKAARKTQVVCPRDLLGC